MEEAEVLLLQKPHPGVLGVTISHVSTAQRGILASRQRFSASNFSPAEEPLRQRQDG